MKDSALIHIGTSGWNYPHWREVFYPEDLPSKKWLDFYGKHFSTVEINNSFYRLPEEEQFTAWRKGVSSDFIFSVKASRYITHMKKLRESGEAVERFMKHVKQLGEKLGVILFQLPPNFSLNLERLESFLDLLPDGHRYTFEFRDRTWWDSGVYEALERKGAAFTIFDLAGEMSPKEVTADFVYLRLHGPGDKYQGSYETKELAGWAGAFSSWARSAKEIYCYFDNDQAGYAARDALRLREMVKEG